MLEIDWRKPHLWRLTTPLRPAAPALAGEREADLLVVGGGFTGLAAALAAREAGLRVIVLEGNEIGSAASGRNHGLVISHHSGASPREFEAAYGKGRGGRYNEMVSKAGGVVFDLIRRFGIDAHQQQNGWFQPAHTEATVKRARQFHDEWKALGADVEWLDRAEISDRLGSPYLGGWAARNSGHVNPFALVTGLASALEGLGVVIHENSRATRLAREGGRWRVATAQGSVTAPQVILATNALTGDIWPGLKKTLIPMAVYQCATAPLPPELRARILRENPAVSDMRHDLRYFRYDVEGRLVSGGLDGFGPLSEAEACANVGRMLARAFPAFGGAPKMQNYWRGVFAVVPDRKPRLYRLGPGLIFGGVYSGRGVALSLSYGQELGRLAAGQRTDDQMPVPVTTMRKVPFHPVAVQVANRMHPLSKWRDRKEERP